jgi:bifunctional enzyme CysN/CysC
MHKVVSHQVRREARWLRQGHRSGVLWFTGLSGSGKSSLAVGLERVFFDRGMRVIVLDGDNLRHGLNGDLGFSDADRQENIRRVSEVAALFAEAGYVVVTAFISPFQTDRADARDTIGEGFREIFIHADLEVCEQRDPKGLYAKARSGEITDFTGISSPYEAPPSPDLIVNSGKDDFDACVATLVEYADRVFQLDG